MSQSPASDTLTNNSKKDNVVFDSTAEFYKSIGIGFQESMKKNTRYNQFLQNQSRLQNNGGAVGTNDDDNTSSSPTRLPYKEEEEEERKLDYDSEGSYRMKSEDYDTNYDDTKLEASSKFLFSTSSMKVYFFKIFKKFTYQPLEKKCDHQIKQ